VLVNVVNRADVRVVERGSGARFAPETFERVRILHDALRENLERDLPAQAQIFSLVDDGCRRRQASQ
jgi:hypothetical protein